MVNWFKKSPTPAPRRKGPGKPHPHTPQPMAFDKKNQQKRKPDEDPFPYSSKMSFFKAPSPVQSVENKPPPPAPVEKVVIPPRPPPPPSPPPRVIVTTESGVGSSGIHVVNSSTSTTGLVTDDVVGNKQKNVDLKGVEEVLCQLLKRTEYLKCNMKKPAIVKLCIDVNKSKNKHSVYNLSDSDTLSDCCEMSPDVRVVRKSRKRKRSRGDYQECSCSCRSSRQSCCR